MDVWLIRHGESAGNAGEKSEFPGSPPLTEKGRQEAQAVADSFTSPPGGVIVSSYLRAIQTAEPLLKKFDLTPETWAVQEWSFLEPSRYQGTTHNERAPAVRAYIERNDPDYRDGPQAESFTDLIGRVDHFMYQLDSAIFKPWPLAVFTHGHFIKAVLWRLFLAHHCHREDRFQSFLAFSDSFVVQNGLMLNLKRGSFHWYLKRRRDVRLPTNEEGSAPS